MTIEEVDIISHAETKFYKIYKSEIMKRNHPKNVKAALPLSICTASYPRR
jgi:hypothetical protein